MIIGNPFYDPEDAPKPGAWEWDEKEGRRFRRVGGIIEWEQELITAHAGKIPESSLKRYNENVKKQNEESLEAARKKQEEANRKKFCPLKSSTGYGCSPNYCALYVSGACALSKIGTAPAANTRGRDCPFTRGRYSCNPRCALFVGDGCRITALITESEEK